MRKQRRYLPFSSVVKRAAGPVALCLALLGSACSGSKGAVVTSPTDDGGGPSPAGGEAPPPVLIPGDRVITSQTDINELMAVTAFAIGGDLILEGIGDTDLTGLDSLVQVEGSLLIRDNPGLQRLPLDGLQHVAGDLVVRGNPVLHTVGVFPRLERLNGSIVLEGNGPADLGGFAALDRLDGDLRIAGYDGLRVVSGFGKLIRIGGSLQILNNHGTALRLPGLQRLARVQGGMQVESNSIDTLVAPAGLLSVGGSLEVTDNSLHALSGLGQLKLIEGSFVLAADDSLQVVEELTNLTEIGGALSLRGLSRLSTVAFLDGLSRVDGGFELVDNTVLATVRLPRLQRAGGMRLTCDPLDCALQEMEFAELDRLHGDLVIAGTRLLNLDGLSHLRTVEGDLILQFNDALDDIQGLAGLDTLGGEQALFINERQPLDQIADLVEQLRDHGFEGEVQIVGGFTGLAE